MPLLSSHAGAGDAPKQFSQPSRKGKKAWRKNVDLTEVESGLVELNDQIIQGGVIREKASEDLFTIDVKGDSAISRKSSSKHLNKTLRADEIIAQRSAVPAVPMRKRPSDKTTDGLVATKRLRQDWVSHKELARLRRVADGRHDDTVAVRDATYDVWAAPAAAIPATPSPSSDVQQRQGTEGAAADAMDFVEVKVQPKVPRSMRRQPVSLLASGKHVPAVARPSGGFSYNPMFADYEGRLADESAKALEAERRRLDQEAADAERQAAAARSAAEADAAEERAAMSEWEEDSEWEGVQSGAEEDGRPKQPKRKTQAQRNRILRRKEDERLAKHKAALKARRAQEQRIKEIAQEVADRDAARALAVAQQGVDAAEADDAEVAEEKLRRKQLGKFKLPEKDLELVLPDELQDSLRLLKPEGNLLRDRYRSLLLRGKMESRRHIPFKRQAKRKVTEKWTHKDFVL
ncbi:Uncharacterized protein ESCO_006831 [Escovopsis weberi]|uniref:Ribosome biogenesis protein NOP53 n=1 Tax=Escovopsis weberi TaxID=150374 RepID=A0A0M9VV73_ESCWE|nr:Uncharacterized protein ESCO_006831 [Escovopsis weberi]